MAATERVDLLKTLPSQWSLLARGPVPDLFVCSVRHAGRGLGAVAGVYVCNARFHRGGETLKEYTGTSPTYLRWHCAVPPRLEGAA